MTVDLNALKAHFASASKGLQAFVIFLFITNTMTKHRPPSNNQNAHGSDSHGGDNTRRITGTIGIAGKVETGLPPKLLKEYEDSNRATDTRENKRFVVERVTLAIVLIVAIFSYIQTRQSIKSADAAVTQSRLIDEQFKLSQRPWVSSSPSVDSDFVFDQSGGFHLTLKFTLHNSGLTPATNAFVYAKFFRLDTNLAEAKEQKRITCQAAISLVEDSEELIIPGGDATQQRGIGVKGSDLSGYKTSTPYLPIQIVACVAYKSPEGTIYTAPQIYSLDGINVPNQPKGIFGAMQMGQNVPAFQLRVIPKNSDAWLTY